MRLLTLVVTLSIASGNAQAPPKRTPDPLPVLVARAQAAEQENRLEEAVSLYKEILRIRPGWASAELNLGLVYHARADYNSAIEILTKALQHNSGLRSAWLFRGASYYHVGQYASAIRDLKRYLQEEPDSTEALSYLGNAQVANANAGDAAITYARLTRISGEASAYFQLIECYLELARDAMESLAGQDSETYKRRILSADSSAKMDACELPSNPELTHIRCAADRFEFEDATRALVDILRKPRPSQERIFNIVEACRRLANAGVAKVIALAPESTWAALLRAQTAEQSGATENAKREYERAVAASDAGLESYVRFGQFESKIGHYDGAVALYEQALKIEPKNARILGLVGEAYTRQDQPEKAVKYLEEALRTNPHESQMRLYLAQSLVRLNRLSEAVKVLLAAPSDSDGRLHYLLGRTYQQMGETEKARQAMNEFRRLRKGPTP